jgi:hypothetical protein
MRTSPSSPRHERRMQAERAEADKALKKKAYAEEMERRRKAEEARRETEAILMAQAEEVARRKTEMAKRDAERLKRMEVEAQERAVANLEKRKQVGRSIGWGEGETSACCETVGQMHNLIWYGTSGVAPVYRHAGGRTHPGCVESEYGVAAPQA